MSISVSRESISKLMTELVDTFPMESDGRSSISDFGKLLFTEGQASTNTANNSNTNSNNNSNNNSAHSASDDNDDEEEEEDDEEEDEDEEQSAIEDAKIASVLA
uniref:Uncharacterized protein n=1 Tax=Globisporangium ultimum (strain ATCC 200006 / CBS 805.95 / DAOM BR144) TaxID=431595 RepID=K3W5Q2_GLOUD